MNKLIKFIYVIVLLATILNFVAAVINKDVSASLGWLAAGCWLSILIGKD